jgi:hypothetical protein
MDTLTYAFDRDQDFDEVHDVQFGQPLFPNPLPVAPRAPVMGEAAAPDVPAALGWMILAAYGAILAAFLTLYTGNLRATMMVAISGVYMAVFFAVPVFFLKQELKQGDRPSYARFLARGLDTWTGHIHGREAAILILSIPVVIACAIILFGIIAAIEL